MAFSDICCSRTFDAPVCRVDLIGDHSNLVFIQNQEGFHVILPSTAEATRFGNVAFLLRIHTHS